MRLIMCSCASEMAQMVAETLIERRLTSLVNTVPQARRTYLTGEYEMRTEERTLLFIHSMEEKLEEIISSLVEILDESAPPIVSMELFEGAERYVSWAEDFLDPFDPPDLSEE